MTLNSYSKNTYDASAGNSRDVTNIVTNVSPTDHPFFSLIRQGTMTARVKENVEDTNTAADATNAMVEGDTFTNTADTERTVSSNVAQIFRKVIEVTESQEAVDKYGGIKSEISYQSKKALTELATDVEKALIQGTSATGATNSARRLSGLVEKCTTNTATAATDAALWTGTAAADLAAFEDLLNDLFEAMWNTGQKADHVLVGGDRKRRISKLSTNVTRNVDAEKKTQIAVINIYDSDFGTMNVILDRYVPDVNIVAVAVDMFITAYLRRFKTVPLGKTTDSTRLAVVGELTLDVKTEKAIGKITAS